MRIFFTIMLHLVFITAMAVVAFIQEEFRELISLWYIFIPMFLGYLLFTILAHFTDNYPKDCNKSCCIGFNRLLCAIILGLTQAGWIVGLCTLSPMILTSIFLVIVLVPFLRGFSCNQKLDLFVIVGLDKKDNYIIAVIRLYHELLFACIYSFQRCFYKMRVCLVGSFRKAVWVG